MLMETSIRANGSKTKLMAMVFMSTLTEQNTLVTGSMTNKMGTGLKCGPMDLASKETTKLDENTVLELLNGLMVQLL